MKANFAIGLLKGLLYYAIGFIITWLAYLAFGWQYIHGPGLHHLVGFLFLLGGVGWVLYCLALFLGGQKTKVNMGVLAVHISVILAVVFFIAFSLKANQTTEIKSDRKRTITINRNDTTNEVSIVDGNNDTLYSKIQDTTFVDKIWRDSTTSR